MGQTLSAEVRTVPRRWSHIRLLDFWLFLDSHKVQFNFEYSVFHWSSTDDFRLPQFLRVSVEFSSI